MIDVDRSATAGDTGRPPSAGRTLSVNDPNLSGPGDRPGLVVLLVVVATAVMAAQSQAWASAVATAAAVYSVVTETQNRS